jgi:hypothetical protein
MMSLVIGGLVFSCVFGGELLGMFLSSVLPKHHLSTDSKDLIKVSMAMIATLSALVLGLLIASAKSSFDSKDGELRRAAAQTVLLDRTMTAYGPETRKARDQLRQLVTLRIRQIWPEEHGGMVEPEAISRGQGVEVIQTNLLELSPQNDAQRWLKSTALQLTGEIAEARWLVLAQAGSGIQWPFLTILVFWLAMIFASFGLFAPRNGSVLIALFVCALSVAGSLYLIIQMDQPYSGLIKISSAPLRIALDQFGRE